MWHDAALWADSLARDSCPRLLNGQGATGKQAGTRAALMQDRQGISPGRPIRRRSQTVRAGQAKAAEPCGEEGQLACPAPLGLVVARRPQKLEKTHTNAQEQNIQQMHTQLHAACFCMPFACMLNAWKGLKPKPRTQTNACPRQCVEKANETQVEGIQSAFFPCFPCQHVKVKRREQAFQDPRSPSAFGTRPSCGEACQSIQGILARARQASKGDGEGPLCRNGNNAGPTLVKGLQR